MRLDLFLKSSRLVMRRTVAQQYCDKGLVKLNGQPAKSSREVKAGDVLQISRGPRTLEFKILELPTTKQVSRESAAKLVQLLSETVSETF